MIVELSQVDRPVIYIDFGQYAKLVYDPHLVNAACVANEVAIAQRETQYERNRP